MLAAVMARPLRIEYPGAVYHVIARGNQGRAIFKDDHDRQRFLETLGQACEKTGWRIHAYVLMGNHYHFLIETPEANLVAGMKWLQGTYTQRYNIRHKIFGHLFQGRYKAVPVEASNLGYLEAVSTYIHLNPARAGLIEIGKQKLKSYLWSSYPWYLAPSSQVPVWLERERVTQALRFHPKDRRGYEVYLEGRVLELALKSGRADLEKKWKELRRGWYVGDDHFAASLRDQLDRSISRCWSESHSGDAKREHGEQTAERLLHRGLASLGLAARDLILLPKTSIEKAALAHWLRGRTTVSLRWLSARLEMGHYTNANRGPRRMNPENLRRYQYANSKLKLLEVSLKK